MWPMPDTVSLRLNGARLEVPCGTSVAAAMLIARQAARVSVTREPRVALCGMGICFECRAQVNGFSHRRTCQLACEPGMIVETNP
jgi:sarcosine oxidase subunit alpha